MDKQWTAQYVIDTAQQRLCPVYKSNCIETCVAFKVTIDERRAVARCNHFKIEIAQKEHRVLDGTQVA